jgi:hypothetical protein
LVGGLLGTALLTAGVLLASLGAAAQPGPADVVRDYFAALARGDAAQALGYGAVPAGPRRLLTGTVLHEQLRIAPLRDITVAATDQHGDRATVAVHYSMGFAAGAVSTSAQVALHRTNGTWWLDRTAVGVRLAADTARDRLTVLGGPVPTRRTLLFPGALPVTTDTRYLELVPTLDYASFGSASTVDLVVRVSEAGQRAFRAAVRTALRRCLARSGDPACPLPTNRYVPGSVSGRLTGSLGGLVDLDQSDPAGLLTYAGRPTVIGSWQRLDFDNVPVPARGRVKLDVRASGYAVAPLQLRWTR